MRELASEGAGITFLPNYFAAPYVRTGKLETIEIAGRSMTVPLVMLYPSRGQVPRKVIALRDFLLDWLRKAPLKLSGSAARTISSGLERSLML